MSRHRNIRSMNYSEECEEFDDVYGHSVEEDHCISPSEARFLYDRTRHPQMSAFLNEDNYIAEEDEQITSGLPSDLLEESKQRAIDEDKLKSCIDDIQNVIGDMFSQSIIEEIVLKHNYDIQKSLDDILNYPSGSALHEKFSTKKETKMKNKNTGLQIVNLLKPLKHEAKLAKKVNTELETSSVTIISSGTPTKGFEISDSNKLSSNLNHSKYQNSPGRASPNEHEDSVKTGSIEKGMARFIISNRDNRPLDVEEQYKKERGDAKEILHMVVIGHVDAGKSTLMGHLLFALGVSQLAVVVNKLDTVGWSEERFNEISSKLRIFLKQVGYRESDVVFVPCSGLIGENLIKKATEDLLIKWYKGPCLLDVIDNFKAPLRPLNKPLRISISDVYKGTGSGFCIIGHVETGMVQPGDKVLVMPQNEIAHVKGVCIDEIPVQSAFAGDNVSLTLANYDIQHISIGCVLSDPLNPVPTATRFEARIVVFNINTPITAGHSVVMHAHSLVEQAVIIKLIAQLKKSSGEILKKHPRCLVKNSNADVEIETSRPICLELYREFKELGRFMLRIGGVSIAAGLVIKIF